VRALATVEIDGKDATDKRSLIVPPNGSVELAVRVAVQAKVKIKCSTCGASNRSSHQFCRSCGTVLRVI
jgi:hypothetical protein